MAHCGRVCRKGFSVFLLRSGIFITLSLEHVLVPLRNEKPEVHNIWPNSQLLYVNFFTLLTVFSVGILSLNTTDGSDRTVFLGLVGLFCAFWDV